jgi:hypothetical protein
LRLNILERGKSKEKGELVWLGSFSQRAIFLAGESSKFVMSCTRAQFISYESQLQKAHEKDF